MKNQTPLSIIIIILMISSLTSIALPANAQTAVPAGVAPTNLQTGAAQPLPVGVTPDQTFNTLARINIAPNPIGVNQSLLVNLWTEPPVHSSRLYNNYMLTITKPDGSKDTIGPISSYYADTTAFLSYTPTQVGNYSFVFNFPGAYFPAGNYTSQASFDIGTVYSFTQSSYYKPASSPIDTLVVQQDPVASWPASPLPTDYWSFPVSPENREWWSIMGSYPATGVCAEPNSIGGVVRPANPWPADTNTYVSNYGYVPYVQGPTSAHIAWMQQGAIGGLAGGTAGQITIDAGQSGVSSVRVNAGSPSIIYQGRAYQTYSKPGVRQPHKPTGNAITYKLVNYTGKDA